MGHSGQAREVRLISDKDKKIGRFAFKQSQVLILILALLLILKLAAWVNVAFTDLEQLGWGDSKLYHDTAVALLRLGTFSFSVEHPEIPQTYRTPGYPAFLAAIYAIFGESWPAVAVVQMFISLLTIVLTYHIALRLWNSQAALLSALLSALDPVSFAYSLKVMTETLFAFLIVAMVFFGILFIRAKNGAIWALLLGLSLALATLVRPLSYYLVFPTMAGFIVLGLIRRWNWRRIVISSILIVIPSVLFIGAWKLRNYRLTHSSVYTSIEGYYAYFWQAAAVIAARDGLSVPEAQRKLGMGQGESQERWFGYRELHPEVASLTFEQVSERWNREGKQIIRKHPFLFVEIYLSGMFAMLTRPGTQALVEMIGLQHGYEPLTSLRHKPLQLLPVAYSLFYLLFLYLGVLIFFWFVWRHKNITAEILFVGGVALYILVCSGGPSAIARFRIPLIPFFALLAAAGYHFLRAQIAARDQS